MKLYFGNLTENAGGGGLSITEKADVVIGTVPCAGTMAAGEFRTFRRYYNSLASKYEWASH